MQIEETTHLRRLEARQLWKLEHGYIYIVEQGRRLIHYKLLRQPNQKAAATRLIGIEAMLSYLRQSEAQLVGEQTGHDSDYSRAALRAGG